MLTSSLGLVELTKIREDGLRYTSKAAGCSDFGYLTASIGTMSCFKCGKHFPRSQGSHRTLLGASRFVCVNCCNKPKNSSIGP